MFPTCKENQAVLKKALSSITHDLKTPVAVLSSNIELLKDQCNNFLELELCQLAINEFHKSISHFELANNLLKNRITASIKEFHFNELTDKLFLSDLFTDFDINRIKLTNKVSGNICSDIKLVSYTLSELIKNALCYSKQNIYISALLASNNNLEIEIRDKGIGIPTADMNFVQTLFFRGSNIGYRKGSGLGLVIANECIRLLSGKLTIQSTINQGTIIKIQIPNEKDTNY